MMGMKDIYLACWTRYLACSCLSSVMQPCLTSSVRWDYWYGDSALAPERLHNQLNILYRGKVMEGARVLPTAEEGILCNKSKVGAKQSSSS